MSRLLDFYRGRRFGIPEDTFRYWTDAVEGTPFHT